jgi:hypothetical protein
MSSHALGTAAVPEPEAGGARRPAEPSPEDARVLLVLRHLDLGLLVVALPVFIVAGLPLLGYGATAVAWLAQRAIQSRVNRRARATNDPRTVAGLLTASMIGRGWLMAGAIFAAGMVERTAGLAAAVLAIALFSLYFSGNLWDRR